MAHHTPDEEMRRMEGSRKAKVSHNKTMKIKLRSDCCKAYYYRGTHWIVCKECGEKCNVEKVIRRKKKLSTDTTQLTRSKK